MWSNLPKNQKEKYKKIITNFASLSESFAQKSKDNEIVAPIVNSKFQEKAFKSSFNATIEDINNTSYDASILTKNNNKYIVGIKSFGMHSSDQKIAQFKKSSHKWESINDQILKNKAKSNDAKKIKNLNNPLYLKIAKKLSELRNQRIMSSRAQLIGFKDSPDVESVYHVLMPSKKGEMPTITVGETSYSKIDVNSIQVIGPTTNNNPNNFKFKDKYHEYKYTASDSQLFMNFQNKEIGIESWNIKYMNDSTSFFENMNSNNKKHKNESYSWIIYNKNGYIDQYSGFNFFNGQTKLGRKNNVREKRINNICKKYKSLLDNKSMNKIKTGLKIILLKKWQKNRDKEKMNIIRKSLMNYVSTLNNKTLKEDVENTIYRSPYEIYIPIPNSKEFHNKHPNFFKNNVGKFKSPKSNKLLLPKEKRTFTLRFLPSEESIETYINQESGKSIQSYGKQTILGKWLIKSVFQLQNRETLTKNKLDDLGFNGIRLTKNIGNNCIDLSFIYIDIDKDNPDYPNDYIGWRKK